MASIIRIKRSTGTSAPGSLKSGELAYSYGAGTQADNGDRLFFGSGDDGSGNATSVVVIGGKYFSDMLDHVHGTLTANSALITDAQSKLNNLKVDNIDLNGNTISSTNANGNLVLDPNGNGTVDVNSSRITSVTDPTSAQDAATKAYVDAATGAVSLTLTYADDASSQDSIDLTTETLQFTGGTGLTSTASTNTISFKIDSTGVTAGTYGSASAIPVFTVNEQGQLESAGEVAVTHSFDLAGNSGTDTFSTGETLTVTGSAPISTAVTNNQIAISAADATTSSKGVASFNTDDFTVTSGAVSVKSGGISNVQLENNAVTINGSSVSLGDSTTLTTSDIDEGTNLYYTSARADSDARNAIDVTFVSGDGAASYNANTGEISITGPSAAETRAHFSGGTGVGISNGVISIGQAVDPTDDVTFNNISVTNGLVVDGNLQVNGTTTTVSSVNLEVTDNMIYMNAGESAGSPTQYIDVGFAANYNDVGSYAHTGFFRDATDGVWKLYEGYTPEPDSDLDIDVNHASFSYADLRVATLTADNITGASFSGSYSGFDSDIASITTSDITEGSNLYYTTARADSDAKNAIDVQSGTGLSYNPATGIISGTNATTSAKGVASFNGTHFSVSNGAVAAQNITITTGDTNSKAFTLGASFNLNGSTTAGITTSTTGGNLVISAAAATTTQRGTAAFDSDNFSVSAGTVSITDVDGGTY